MKPVALLLFSLCPALCNEPKTGRPDNKSLPKCDKIEILRIDGTTLTDADGQPRWKLEQPPTDVDGYFVQASGGGHWTRLYGTKTVRGEDAERIAALWRALAPEPDPPGVSRGLYKCHMPGYAFRFYAGDKLLAESTVCWGCENLRIHIGGKDALKGFDPKAQPAKDLLAAGTRLFPDVKTEFK